MPDRTTTASAFSIRGCLGYLDSRGSISKEENHSVELIQRKITADTPRTRAALGLFLRKKNETARSRIENPTG